MQKHTITTVDGVTYPISAKQVRHLINARTDRTTGFLTTIFLLSVMVTVGGYYGVPALMALATQGIC
jgi:hypothetical protein